MHEVPDAYDRTLSCRVSCSPLVLEASEAPGVGGSVLLPHVHAMHDLGGNPGLKQKSFGIWR